MFKFEKIIQCTDAVLNCIPIVNTVNNTAQAIYKLAHKVDALNPVVPGLKTSIKIHILSKDYSDYFAHSLPILGNLMGLIDLVLFILNFSRDNLMNAVTNNNTEVVHLCLGNNPFHDPNRADAVFGLSAYSSDNRTFRQVLYSRYDWSGKNLMHGLTSCWFPCDRRVANANDILDYWIDRRKVLDADNIRSATRVIQDLLKIGKTALAQRVIQILPNEVPFNYIKNILLKYSCPQYNYRGKVEETGVLTEEHRNALIAKSKKPSLEELRSYYILIRDDFISKRTADNYRKTHFDTLNKLLDLAQLELEEIEEFIATTASFAKSVKFPEYDPFVFMEFLVTKYEGLLTPELKVRILERLLPSDSERLTSPQRRNQLFACWIGRWKNAISAQTHQLYRNLNYITSQLAVTS